MSVIKEVFGVLGLPNSQNSMIIKLIKREQN